MIFNDDSMLDFRGNGFGQGGMDDLFGRGMGYDIGEVVITGRVPGALYLDDLPGGMTALDKIMPFENVGGISIDQVLVSLDEPQTVGLVTLGGEDIVPADDGGDNGAAVVPANDDSAPATLPALTHGKDEAPLVLVVANDTHDGAPGLATLDQDDLSIPPIPLPAFDAPTVDAVMPTAGEPAPVIIGGRAYESLSFLIIDTPFAVGDGQLPDSLRPSLNELLGLTGGDGQGDDQADDGQAFILPATGWGSWRLG